MKNDLTQKIEEFFKKYKSIQFKKGEIIIRADDDPAGIFYLKSGIVRQYYISKNGEEITLNMFKPLAFFPMSWAISDIHNNYYFEAMTDCETYRAPKEAVITFVKKEPDVLYDLLKRVFRGIEGLWLHIEYLSAGNALSKLIATILILAKRFGEKEGNAIVIQVKLTEKELGEYAGMYRETISREFHILKQKGLVIYNKGTITIPDIYKLEESLPL